MIDNVVFNTQIEVIYNNWQAKFQNAIFAARSMVQRGSWDHLDDNHGITDYHMAMTAAAADRIVDHILYSINDGGILGVAVIYRNGKVLSAKSSGSF